MLRGYRGRMITRTRPVVALALSLVALGMLSGCAPQPKPEPTPSAVFASEEEAFKAAEETYRAYTDALNSQRRGESGHNPLDFLTGSALEDEITGQQEIVEQGLKLKGDVAVVRFERGSINQDRSPIEIAGTVCLDTSQVRVTSADGEDLSPPDRESVAMKISFIATDERKVLISESFGGQGEC